MLPTTPTPKKEEKKSHISKLKVARLENDALRPYKVCNFFGLVDIWVRNSLENIDYNVKKDTNATWEFPLLWFQCRELECFRSWFNKSNYPETLAFLKYTSSMNILSPRLVTPGSTKKSIEPNHALKLLENITLLSDFPHGLSFSHWSSNRSLF